jgi:RNA polymerase sigma factor (sigma-70 family)
MDARPKSNEALERKLLPSISPNRADRARAWAEWQMSVGQVSLLKFIRVHNTTSEPDEDILQEAMMTAYLEVERGRYQPREGVPFTAYVKGIARNKLREARRRGRVWLPLEDGETESLAGCRFERPLEITVERREQDLTLRRGLAMLPGDKRQVLERYLHGESTGEIAAGMAITEDLVRQHKCRGLRQLRQRCDPVHTARAGFPGLLGEGMWAGQSERSSYEQLSPVPACPDDLTRVMDFTLTTE